MRKGILIKLLVPCLAVVFLMGFSTTAAAKQIKVGGIMDTTGATSDVGKDYDPFDLICHVAFDRPPLTRKERAEEVRKHDYFTKYGEQARAVLYALLEKYVDTGIESVEDINVLKIQPLNQFGTPLEIVKTFGGKEHYEVAVKELERELYRVA